MFNLISSAFGSLTTWIIAALIAALIGMWSWVYLLKADIKVEQSERREIENALALQSSLIELNRVNDEENLKVIEQKKAIIQIKYKTQIQIIEKRIETNATCESASEYLNNYIY
ncbi:MAG: hypothetical protein NTW78_03880 [Campylobacterales bacterium]|nr:hypothetical protein [Campylobacterales bacterium]